jgi:WXG100 family type VII secretion target
MARSPAQGPVAAEEEAMSGGGLSDGYNTDVDVMTAAGQKVDVINQNIQNQLKTLRGQVEQVRSAWKGPASARYTTLMQAYDKDTKLLNDALHGIAENLRSNKTQYAQAETDIGGGLSKIESRLT